MPSITTESLLAPSFMVDLPVSSVPSLILISSLPASPLIFGDFAEFPEKVMLFLVASALITALVVLSLDNVILALPLLLRVKVGLLRSSPVITTLFSTVIVSSSTVASVVTVVVFPEVSTLTSPS